MIEVVVRGAYFIEHAPENVWGSIVFIEAMQMIHSRNPNVCVFQQASEIPRSQPSVHLTMTIKTDMTVKMSVVTILFYAVGKAVYSISVRLPAAVIRCTIF